MRDLLFRNKHQGLQSMKFNIVIDVPEETILSYHLWTQKYEKNLHLDILGEQELESIIKDIVEEQTQWEVDKCQLLDKDDLISLKEAFKNEK